MRLSINWVLALEGMDFTFSGIKKDDILHHYIVYIVHHNIKVVITFSKIETKISRLRILSIDIYILLQNSQNQYMISSSRTISNVIS